MNKIVVQNSMLALSDEKKKLLKRTFGGILTDDELDLFDYICTKTGLDPFIKQIYPIRRRNKRKDGTYEDKMMPLVGIDGLRSIAERTGNYCPGKETVFAYNADGSILSATAYVKKRTSDGTWHEISVTAFMCEYRPEYNNFWNDKPHVMLGKCAEALCIRKAFPAVTGNLYISEEIARDSKAQKKAEDTPDRPTQPEAQIIDSSPVSEGPEALVDLPPLERLAASLISEGIAIDRLEEWVKQIALTKGMQEAEVITNCLRVLPTIKKAYLKWLKSFAEKTETAVA